MHIPRMISAELLSFIFAIASAEAQTCGPTGTCMSIAPATCKVDIETIYSVNGCQAAVIASWEGFDNPSKGSSCIANPPQGYILWDHEVQERSSNNGNASVSKY